LIKKNAGEISLSGALDLISCSISEHAEQHRSHESESGEGRQHIDRTAENQGRLPFLS
jgi:hypothetical protein